MAKVVGEAAGPVLMRFRASVEKLLDSSLQLQELDISSCKLDDSDFQHLVLTCTQLKSLTLGVTNDQRIKVRTWLFPVAYCKQELLTHNPNLEKLSFYASKQLTNKAVKMIAEYAPKLETLEIQCSEKINDKAVEGLLRACTRLSELNLHGCKKIKGTAFKPFASSGLGSARKRPLRLRKLNLSYCELSKKGFKHLVKVSSELQSLNFSPLSTSFKITGSDFLNLVHNCKNLLVLNLSSYSFEMDTVLIEVSRCCTQLTTLLLEGLGMTDYGLQNVVQNCARLETLKFKYGDGVSDASLHQIAKSCTALQSLSLDFWNLYNRLSVSDHAIKLLLSSCTNLTELSLCNCLILTGSCLPENAYFPFLTSLNLSECIQLNDFAIRRVSESCPNLRTLKLDNLNNLTSQSLEAIVYGCPLLENLQLYNCSCFKDDTLKKVLRAVPKLFIQVTRYTDGDLRGYRKEVHSLTVHKVFADYPNTYREKAFDKTRKRMFGLET